MTTEKLKIIAPEWVVANGIIRPVNPWSRKRAMELASLTLQRKFNEFMTVVKQHTYATDLPDGTYSAEALKVSWEYFSQAFGPQWREAEREDYDKFTYETWSNQLKEWFIETRIKITQ